MQKIFGEECPICKEKKLMLTEDEVDIPNFGKTLLFSMSCESCGFKKSDVEAVEQKEPIRITFTVSGKKDMNVKLVKSSEARVSIPQLKIEISPGEASEGYITNIEGFLQRIKQVIEDQKKNAECEDGKESEKIKKAAKNLLKKLWDVECGDTALKIIIEDPSGNSTIISNKAVYEKLKKQYPQKSKMAMESIK